LRWKTGPSRQITRLKTSRLSRRDPQAPWRWRSTI
jgi:hypothetical protein